ARFSTSFWNTGRGGPSIDSNATVAPRALMSEPVGPPLPHPAAAKAIANAHRTLGRRKVTLAGARPAALTIDTSPDAPCCSSKGQRRRSSAVVPSIARAVQHGISPIPQRNRVDVAAVIRLAAMGGAAIAEEARVAIGADIHIVDAFDAGAREPVGDKAGEIE